jgi:hypothetical protein
MQLWEMGAQGRGVIHAHVSGLRERWPLVLRHRAFDGFSTKKWWATTPRRLGEWQRWRVHLWCSVIQSTCPGARLLERARLSVITVLVLAGHTTELRPDADTDIR